MTDTKVKEAAPKPTPKKAEPKLKAVPIKEPKTVEAKKQKPKNKWLKLAKKHLLHKQAGRWFAGMVVIPWSIAAVYYTSFASDRYVSETSFMIEKSDGNGGGMEGLSLFGMTPQSSNDHRIVEAFIQSPDMLYFLDEKANLRQHYFEEADPLSRLSADASHESFLKFYRNHMRVRF